MTARQWPEGQPRSGGHMARGSQQPADEADHELLRESTYRFALRIVDLVHFIRKEHPRN